MRPEWSDLRSSPNRAARNPAPRLCYGSPPRRCTGRLGARGENTSCRADNAGHGCARGCANGAGRRAPVRASGAPLRQTRPGPAGQPGTSHLRAHAVADRHGRGRNLHRQRPEQMPGRTGKWHPTSLRLSRRRQAAQAHRVSRRSHLRHRPWPSVFVWSNRPLLPCPLPLPAPAAPWWTCARLNRPSCHSPNSHAGCGPAMNKWSPQARADTHVFCTQIKPESAHRRIRPKLASARQKKKNE